MLPVPLWFLVGVYVLFDLHPVLLALAGDQLFSRVAHAGHLGGLAFGFLYWKTGMRLETVFEYLAPKGPQRQVPRKPHRKVRPRRVPAPESFPARDDVTERVDAVLQKMSEQGKDSLTDDERRILMEASAQYRAKKEERGRGE